MSARAALLLTAGTLVSFGAPAWGQTPISMADSFGIGSAGSAMCTAQLRPFDEATRNMFDRAYALVCRDATAPVGRLYVLKGDGGQPAARLAALRQDDVTCAPGSPADLADIGRVETLSCSLKGFDVPYQVYLWRTGDKLYAAEGLAAYEAALRLGLRSLASDRQVEGEVAIATTQAGDPAAFARVQAGNLNERAARLEAYRRATAGSYAEAVEFFRSAAGGQEGSSRSEALLNEALQQSNLGFYQAAEQKFFEARREIGNDPVLARMLRNYEAIHLLNRQRLDTALAALQKPLPAGAALDKTALVERLVIDEQTAKRLAAEDNAARRLGIADAGLLPAERAEILDAQAAHLRGSMLRMQGQNAAAKSELERALTTLDGVRGGRVASTVWMRAQVHGELAELAERAGDPAGAARAHDQAITVLQSYYPRSPALMNAQGRLAAFLARQGKEQEALALFEGIVDVARTSASVSPALKRTLAPYLNILVRRSGQDPESLNKLFVASQVLVRPGVAQTQSVLARELSGGSDEASRLFRQSVNLTREVERLRVAIAQLSPAGSDPAAASGAQAEALRRQLAEAERAQVATQAKLAEFPKYRVVTDPVIELAQLQEVLQDDEAYYKLVVLNDQSYAIYVSPQGARAFPVEIAEKELDSRVTQLRDTITFLQDGERITYPFDVELAHALYKTMFSPVDTEIGRVRHLVFEPDGAMLRLPPNLLVTNGEAVSAYKARTADPQADAFDFTAIPWLGRDRNVSTAVSVNGFRQVRLAPPSRAANSYIGFGQNKAVGDASQLPAAVRSSVAMGDDCGWSIAEWSRPISPGELLLASRALEQRGRENTAVLVGEAFTDSAIQQMRQLDEYRILHFATHGLVTAPRPRCPARPALLTSFGDGQSDGLLTFAEIFDLNIDADLVILSACDTAGEAGLTATREAGVTTGGDSALDGLVRAFVAAGGRTVVASHWPVPDTFDATQRLIAGMFTAPVGAPVASALRDSQQRLMSDPATSHPFYWAAFAIVGDGAAPMIRQNEPEQSRSASADPAAAIQRNLK